MDYPKTYGYEKRVKISSWDDWIQSDPLGNQKPNYAGGSHFRTLGQTDEIFMPKTSTQDHLESGLQRRIYRTIAKKQINFESYPLNDFRLDSCEMMTDQIEGKYVPTSTTYQDNFKPKMPVAVKEAVCKDEPDRLLNRIPKCGVEYLPSSENKFMDDQLAVRSANRKKIDFFRQIRNSSNLFH